MEVQRAAFWLLDSAAADAMNDANGTEPAWSANSAVAALTGARDFTHIDQAITIIDDILDLLVLPPGFEKEDGHDTLDDAYQKLRTSAAELRDAASERQATPNHRGAEYATYRVTEADIVMHAELIAEIREGLDAVARKTSTAHNKDLPDGWKRWLLDNVAAGARNAYAHTRMPVDWQATTVLTTDGILTADPMRLLVHYKDKYEGMWNCGSRNPADAERPRPANMPWHGAARGVCEALPLIPPHHGLRAASLTFSHQTSSTFDGFAMRH